MRDTNVPEGKHDGRIEARGFADSRQREYTTKLDTWSLVDEIFWHRKRCPTSATYNIPSY